MHGDHVAFYLTELPQEGDVVDPETTILLDGSRPEHGQTVVCGTCGSHFPAIMPIAFREL
jgi:hypothetical protein